MSASDLSTGAVPESTGASPPDAAASPADAATPATPADTAASPPDAAASPADTAARPAAATPPDAAARPAAATPATPPDAAAIAAQLPADVLEAIAALEAAGFQAYLVGGSLRDILRGQPAKDYDIASSARPEQLELVFASSRLLDTGMRYGTMSLLTDERLIEVTTFRSEGRYSDGRHPDIISYTNDLETDLSRRDFTVNAMAFSPSAGLADPFGGQADLAAGLLRAVGDPRERLAEDALRILRALRFSATLGLAIDPALDAAVRSQRQLLSRISPERLQSELMRMLSGPHILDVLLAYGEVLAVLIPEVGPTLGFDQRSPWHIYDIWEHTARALAAISPADPLTRLAALLHDLGKPPAFTIDETGRGHFDGHAAIGEKIARERLKALRFESQAIEAVAELILLHRDRVIPENTLSWLRRIGEPQLRRLLALKIGDMSAHVEHVHEQHRESLLACLAAVDAHIAAADCYSLDQLAVNGYDLIGLGYKPSPALGAALEGLLDAVVEGSLANQRDELLAEASNMLAGAA